MLRLAARLVTYDPIQYFLLLVNLIHLLYLLVLLHVSIMYRPSDDRMIWWQPSWTGNLQHTSEQSQETACHSMPLAHLLHWLL